MLNLIITIIAIALIVLITASTVMHSGSAYSGSKVEVETARYLNEASQIKGAFTVFRSQGNEFSSEFEVEDLVESGYLKSVPIGWENKNGIVSSKISVNLDSSNDRIEQDICVNANNSFGFSFDPSQSDVMGYLDAESVGIPHCEKDTGSNMSCCVVQSELSNDYLIVARKLDESSEPSEPSTPDFIVSTTEEWLYASNAQPNIVFDTIVKNGRTSQNWRITNYDFGAKIIEAKINRSEVGTQYKHIVNTYNSGKIEKIKTNEEKAISITGSFNKVFDLTKECFYSTYNYMIYGQSHRFNRQSFDFYIRSEPVLSIDDRKMLSTKEKMMQDFKDEYGFTPGELAHSQPGSSVSREYYPICG